LKDSGRVINIDIELKMILLLIYNIDLTEYSFDPYQEEENK
jgi:hypothetical protein